MSIVTKMNELRSEISKHNHSYYILDAPTISDAEYDRLFKELQELEKCYPDLVAIDSPTQRVGAPLDSQFNKIKHSVPMLSLDSYTNAEAVREWDKRIRKELYK